MLIHMNIKVVYVREFKEGIFVIVHTLSQDKLSWDYYSTPREGWLIPVLVVNPRIIYPKLYKQTRD